MNKESKEIWAKWNNTGSMEEMLKQLGGQVKNKTKHWVTQSGKLGLSRLPC